MPHKGIMRFIRFLAIYTIVGGQQPSSPQKHGQAQPLVRGQPSLPTPNRNSRHRLRPLADPTTAPGGSATTAVVEKLFGG
jgi:hypothetical protein